jgi:hypothetical protein
MLTSMMGANGLVLLAPGQHAAAGDTVRVQIFGPIGVCDAPVPGPG